MLYELCGQVHKNESAYNYEIAGTFTNAASQCTKSIVLVIVVLLFLIYFVFTVELVKKI